MDQRRSEKNRGGFAWRGRAFLSVGMDRLRYAMDLHCKAMRRLWMPSRELRRIEMAGRSGERRCEGMANHRSATKRRCFA